MRYISQPRLLILMVWQFSDTVQTIEIIEQC